MSKQIYKKISKGAKKLSKKQEYSNNWYKQKQKVAKLHEKIKHQRQDFLHKLSKRIVDENQVIILEDLAVKNMMKNKKLAKNIADVSWHKFYTYLEYKTKWYARAIHKIDKWFPSSKICSYCGHVMEEMPLSIRKWDCPKCGIKNIDRDVNASINILKQGIKELKKENVA
ncbi:RNA-guided endonuclease TnpB family protein [Maledivibacter halophilus]|nr:RNA-guided endonuclease TnpB family protein [Maledivibacter halophilus]